MPRPPRAWQGSRPMPGALDEASGDPGPCLELGLCRLGPPERALGRFRGSRRLVGADSPSSRPGMRFLPAIASARVLSSASHRLTSRGSQAGTYLGPQGPTPGRVLAIGGVQCCTVVGPGPCLLAGCPLGSPSAPRSHAWEPCTWTPRLQSQQRYSGEGGRGRVRGRMENAQGPIDVHKIFPD